MTQAKISLKKSSGKISLKKNFVALEEIRLEFSWTSKTKLDADVSAFICDHSANGAPVMFGAEYLVCYATKKDPENSVLTGEDVRDGTGDKEHLWVNLQKVRKDAKEIAFVVTIDESKAKNLSFAGLTSGELIIYNNKTDEALINYNFGDQTFTNESLIHVASLFQENDGDWTIQAFGTASGGVDIYDAVDMFGGDSRSWF